MNRDFWIKNFFLPQALYAARVLTAWLRAKDDNSTGFDDAAADAGDRFITALEEYTRRPAAAGGALPPPHGA